METFKDEIKNLKAITRVIAALVLANFVIIALVVGPDSVGLTQLMDQLQQYWALLLPF